MDISYCLHIIITYSSITSPFKPLTLMAVISLLPLILGRENVKEMTGSKFIELSFLG